MVHFIVSLVIATGVYVLYSIKKYRKPLKLLKLQPFSESYFNFDLYFFFLPEAKRLLQSFDTG